MKSTTSIRPKTNINSHTSTLISTWTSRRRKKTRKSVKLQQKLTEKISVLETLGTDKKDFKCSLRHFLIENCNRFQMQTKILTFSPPRICFPGKSLKCGKDDHDIRFIARMKKWKSTRCELNRTGLWFGSESENVGRGCFNEPTHHTRLLP